MKTKRITLDVLFIAVLMLSGTLSYAVQPSPYIYQVKLGEFTERDAAEARLASLQPLNIEPLQLVTLPHRLEIHFGEFPYYMDAYLYVQDLKNLGYTDAEILKINNTEGETGFPLVKGPKEKVFKIVETNGILTPCILNMEDPDLAYIDNLINAASTEELHAAVLEKLAARKDDDPAKGWLSMRMAYIKCRMKERGEAQQIFQQIAEGKVKAPPGVRVEAMIRVGYLIHAKKERPRAYRAFKEIYKFAQTPEERAEALLQLCALMMELAQSGKGTLAECRQFYEKALQEIPTNSSIRPTIELMHLESWYKENNYQKCIEEAQAYLEKYKQEPLREIATCRLFMGFSYFKSDRYEQGVDALTSILDLPLGPEDRWKGIPDFKKHALKWLIHFAEKTGHEQDAILWRQMMNDMYPQ